MDWSQVDQRSPSGKPQVVSSIEGSDRRLVRLAVVGASSSNPRLPRRRVLNSPRREEKSRKGDAPRLSDEWGRREHAYDSGWHLAPPFAQRAASTQTCCRLSRQHRPRQLIFRDQGRLSR
jgi:hypothetical protein